MARAKILVVDDEPKNLELLVRTLRRRYDVVTARSGDEALDLLRAGPFAAILSDLRMQGMTGTEFLSEAHKLVPDTVRMILTGYAPEQESVDAINVAHVATFLTKPIAPEAIERAVADAVAHYELSRRNRVLADQLDDTTRELGEVRRLLEMSLDERTRAIHESNRVLLAEARLDPLTGLLSRRAFEERIAIEMERIERYGGTASLLICDVEGFRGYNETHGSAAADRLLVALARVLGGVESDRPLRLRPSDVVARWSGGSFALLTPGTRSDGAAVLAVRILDAVQAASVGVSLRFGLAEAPGNAVTTAALIDAAERAVRT